MEKTKMSIYLGSGAKIVNKKGDYPCIIVEYSNPEIELVEMLHQYLLEFGFSSQYPNFDKVRISSVHPFANLLLQEILGQELDFSVFPSIAIMDTSDSETDQILGKDYEQVLITPQLLAVMEVYFHDKHLLISDENLSKLRVAIKNHGRVLGIKRTYRAIHNLDFSIWSDNKDVTSILYDAVKQFFVSKSVDLHGLGFDIQAPMSGRRSGDINLDFGRILYGANITSLIEINTGSMFIDFSKYDVIDHIISDGAYHVLGG